MQPIITICARKGSKGLANKSIRYFNGKPLICWTIETALEWGIGPVVVSSDDSKIKNYFLGYINDDIYFDERPANFAQDDTPKLEVLKHIVNKTQESMETEFSYVVDLDVTNPCRTVKDLEKCRELFEKNKYKTLFSVTKAKKNPDFNQIIFENGKYTTLHESSGIITRRQDARTIWNVNSNIYFYDTQWLLRDTINSPLTNDMEIYVMPDHAFCDIDSKLDFQIAEFLHRKYYA